MTDKEIIKALECCARIKDNDCSNCPFTESRYCTAELATKVLTRINRQKAEIKRLENKLFDANEGVEFYKANLMAKCKEIDKAKSEAIQAFAERLKERSCVRYMNAITETAYQILKSDFDNLVKEMVSDE